MSRATQYNSMVDDNAWKLVNKDNKLLLKDFIEYKKSTDKSLGTCYQYEAVVKLFFVWNLQNNDNKFFIDLKKRELIRFFGFLNSDLKSSPNRQRTVRAILSSLSNYIENILDEDYPDFRNIVKKIEPVTKEATREKTVLTQQQVDKCLEDLVSDGKYEIACFMALACASGARKSELLRFKHKWFVDENIVCGCMWKTPEKITTKGRGSRGKLLNKFIFINQFKRYFDLWMEERKKLNIESEWLFVSKSTQGEYSQSEVHNADFWAKTIEKYLGCDFYFHSLRHFMISNLRAKKLPDAVIIEIVGWEKESGSSMISIYDDNEVLDSFAEYFDENGIKEIKQGKINEL